MAVLREELKRRARRTGNRPPNRTCRARHEVLHRRDERVNHAGGRPLRLMNVVGRWRGPSRASGVVRHSPSGTAPGAIPGSPRNRLRRRKRVTTTSLDPSATPVPDLFRRDFTATAPNTTYVGGITCLPWATARSPIWPKATPLPSRPWTTGRRLAIARSLVSTCRFAEFAQRPQGAADVSSTASARPAAGAALRAQPTPSLSESAERRKARLDAAQCPDPATDKRSASPWADEDVT